MAESKPIKSEEVVQKGLFKEPTKSAEEFAASLDQIEQGFKAILAEQQKFLQLNKGNLKQVTDIKKLNDAITKSKDARIGLAAVEKARITVQIQQERLTQTQMRTQKQANAEADRAAKAAAKLKTETEKLNSVYQKQSKELLRMKKEVKDLLAADRELTEAEKKLVKETQLLDDKLKKIDKTIGDGHRSVGLYTDGFKEAIASTRLFDGELAHTLVQLKSLAKQWKDNTEGSNKFSNALKLTAVGLLVLAVGIAKALADAGKNTSQVVSDFLEIKDAQFGIQKATDAAARSAAKLAGDETGSLQRATELRVEYIKLLTRQTKALEALSLAQHDLALDEEDFRQITADTTIGLEARNKALKEAQRIEKERLENEVAQAKIKVELAKTELSREEALAGLENAKPEFYAKRNEAVKALKTVEDALADTIRINDEDQRKLNIEKASLEIDLLLKKKQSANAEKVILENQLADERKQLEERRIIADKLLKVNQETTAEEIKLFKENTGIKFDENELLGEQDAILLQRKIEGIKQTVINQKGEVEQVGIGTEAIVKIAQIIKKAQEDQIENSEKKAELDKEEIKRKQKIADIEKEIAIIKQESIVKSTEDSADKQKEISEKADEDILNKEGVFSRKQVKRRKLLADAALAKDKEVIDEKIKLLGLERDREKQAIDDSINDDKIKAAEKLKIDAKYLDDLSNLEADKRAADIEFADKEAEELRKREIRRAEIVVTNLQNVTNALENEVQKQNDKRVEGIDRELDEREKAIEKQTELAQNGQKNQLAFEIAAQKKAELEKKEIEERAARQEREIQLANAYFAAYLVRLAEANADPNLAPFLAAKDVVLANGVAKGLAGLFAEGTELVEKDLKGNKVHNGTDGYVIGVDGSERIMTGDQNKMIGNMSNEDLANLAYSYQRGLLGNVGMPDYSKGDNAILNAQALAVFTEMKADLQAIKNKPVQILKVNELGEWVETLITASHTKKTTYKFRP